MDKKETVVVLDDDPGTAMSVKGCIRMLEPSWNVVATDDPEQALGMLAMHPVSCLVTDLMMPKGDGMGVARRVRELEESSGSMRFVVMLTGQPANKRLQALEVVNEFLPKPPEPRELTALLRQGLRMARRSVDLVEKVRSLGQQAMTDPLTGLHNRRHGEEAIAHELDRSSRSGDPFGVLMVDVDHFKAINDERGHEVGDRVLQALSRRFQECLRPYDVLVRWGGEEFLVLLPGAGLADAVGVAERLRRHVGSLTLAEESGLRITASFGVACADSPLATRDLLIKAADRALYQAKASGRNRVECEAVERGVTGVAA